MTIAGLVNALAAMLREVLDVPVEKYWRAEPPTQATVFVQPREEKEESRGIGGAWLDVLSVDVLCETPWDDTVETAEKLIGIVDGVKGLIEQNRDLHDGEDQLLAQRGSIEKVRWEFVRRPGAGHPTFAGIVAVSYRPSK